jgi:hypothetical protein
VSCYLVPIGYFSSCFPAVACLQGGFCHKGPDVLVGFCGEYLVQGSVLVGRNPLLISSFTAASAKEFGGI